VRAIASRRLCRKGEGTISREHADPWRPVQQRRVTREHQTRRVAGKPEFSDSAPGYCCLFTQAMARSVATSLRTTCQALPPHQGCRDVPMERPDYRGGPGAVCTGRQHRPRSSERAPGSSVPLHREGSLQGWADKLSHMTQTPLTSDNLWSIIAALCPSRLSGSQRLLGRSKTPRDRLWVLPAQGRRGRRARHRGRDGRKGGSLRGLRLRRSWVSPVGA
jgi:hypothetical protein